MTTARYALGFVVSLGALGTLGACGGRYELGEGESTGGKAGGGGGPGTGGTGGTLGGSGGSGGKSGSTGGTGGGGTGGTEISSGGSAADGTGGTGNVGGEGTGGFVSQIRPEADKVDLLLVVDNSIGMADKQALLAQAVSRFLGRFTNPDCVDGNGAPLGSKADSAGNCDQGSPEIPPVRDIHIGVITSSLGDHGSGDICSMASDDGTHNYNDGALLLGATRSGLVADDDFGFVIWDPEGGTQTPGISDENELAAAIADHVRAAGERGCGYEAPLEAMYRFLIDPEPVTGVTNDGALTVRGEVATQLLQQRAAFLRPDSVLGIIMLTDENDCSILDENGTQGWLVPFKGGIMSNNWRMPRATGICATQPNDPGCQPCGITDDPSCDVGASLTPQEDPPNLRCFKQKQRFGVDLLYPTSRYVQGLTSPFIDPRITGNPVPNPLFTPSGDLSQIRGPGSVYFMGIVGVPWQDVATEDALDGGPMAYLTADELVQGERWDLILGDPSSVRNPTDPFMIESVDPRPSGLMHPILGVGAVVVPPDGSDFNPINGREQPAGDRYDLQRACIFALPEPRTCTAGNEGSCDCGPDQMDLNSALCEYEAGEQYGTQLYAKAHPGLRQLEVMKNMGSNAVVTSVCAAEVTSLDLPQGPAYGYNPNMDALFGRMKENLQPLCLPRPFDVDADGRIACRMVEVSTNACDCSAPGRSPATPADLAATQNDLESLGACSNDGGSIACDSLCACELAQLEGDELDACRSEVVPPAASHGFCYAGADVPGSNPALVAGCPATQKQRLRFVGDGVPAADKLTMIVCEE